MEDQIVVKELPQQKLNLYKEDKVNLNNRDYKVNDAKDNDQNLSASFIIDDSEESLSFKNLDFDFKIEYIQN